MNRVLLKYELLTLLRDSRTLFLSIVLPIVLLPALLFTLNRYGADRGATSQTDFRYARAPVSAAFDEILKEALGTEDFRQINSSDSEHLLIEGHLELLISLMEPDPTDPDLGQEVIEQFPSFEPLVLSFEPGRPVIELAYRADRDRSVRAFLEARNRLQDFRRVLVREVVLTDPPRGLFTLEDVDESKEQERIARSYGPALSAFLVLMLLGGGSVAALDSLAGERERGTLSTLFASSLARDTILGTKFVAVALISLVIALAQVLNLAVYAAFDWLALPSAFLAGTGKLGLVVLALIFVVEAIFTAALLLHISARSRSFKEAQLFFFPAFLVAFVLSLTGLMPGLPIRSVFSLIPIVGAGVAIPEILAGRIDLLVVFMVLLGHLLATYGLMKGTSGLMAREDFLGDLRALRGEELLFDQFSQRALPFFALLGAGLVVLPGNFAVLSSLTGQVLFNQVILFGLGPYLLMRFYRRKFTKVVPLRAVSWKILILCLAMVPVGQIAATGLSHLLGPILPPPVRALEEMLGLLDVHGTPTWQLFLLIGILPGLFEEFAFRGVLLHSLHRRFSPWLVISVVALIFGLFHINFFRVLPTAFLGFFMGLLTMATGSLWPAILVHMGNNSLAVAAMQLGWDLEHLGWGSYVSATVGLILISALVLRWGEGYPGTRWAKASSVSKRQVVEEPAS